MGLSCGLRLFELLQLIEKLIGQPVLGLHVGWNSRELATRHVPRGFSVASRCAPGGRGRCDSGFAVAAGSLLPGFAVSGVFAVAALEAEGRPYSAEYRDALRCALLPDAG